MIWLSTLSVVVGGLLARRFTIIALVPATFVIVVIAVALGEAKIADIWSIVFTAIVASVGIQVGYFFSLYAQKLLFARESSPLDAVVMTPADQHGQNEQLPSAGSPASGNAVAPATGETDQAGEDERRRSASRGARPVHQT